MGVVRRRVSPTTAWLLVSLVWTAVIWGHSFIQGPDSANESGLVVQLVRPVFELAGMRDVETITLVVRKLAHFSEYAVLGYLVGRLRGSLRRGRSGALALSVAWVLFVPVIDETIQLHVPGRAGSPVDVLIDLCGVALGSVLALVVLRFRD
ncbi:MAG: VanZ family protein [Olsenella sp.]|nr:VanZ family protein [Olsenella sp.]